MKTLCDKCKYQVEKGKCNSFEVLAMTMTTSKGLKFPEFRKITPKEEEYLTYLNFCMGYKEDKPCKN